MSKAGKIALATLGVILAALIAFAVVNETRSRRIKRTYAEANALFDQGAFEEAAEIYRTLGDWNGQRRCQEGLVDRQALAMVEDGKPDEALALLKSDHPDSKVREEVVLALAEQLAADGDPGAAAKLVQDERAGDMALRLGYADMANEQDFWKDIDNGDVNGAQLNVDAIRDRHSNPDEVTVEKLDAMRAALEKAKTNDARKKAGETLAEGRYAYALKQYADLDDAEGMAAVVEALLEPEDLISDIGRMNGAGDILKVLIARDDDASAALAGQLAEGVAEACRARIDAGERSAPWNALQRLKKWAPSLWREDWQAMMDGCTSPMPAQSGVFRDTGLAVSRNDASGTATITATNRTGRGMLLSLTLVNGVAMADADRIVVFVRPTGQYTFTIKAGQYMVNVATGFNWFGDGEGLGILAETQNVKVMNGPMAIERGDRLEGSYSITVG